MLKQKGMRRILVAVIVMVLFTGSLPFPAQAASKLSKPKVMSFWDGEYKYVFDWFDVEDADSYEVQYNGKKYNVPNSYIYLNDPEPGTSGEIKVRAVSSQKKVSSSDWTTYSFKIPKVENSMINDMRFATLLSASQLKAWMTYWEYDYSTSSQVIDKTNYTIISIDIKDENNEKSILGAAGDIILGGVAGLLGGGVAGWVDDTDDLDTKSGAKAGLVAGAFESGMEYLASDTDIHLKFYYPKGDEDKAAAYAKLDYLVANQSDPADDYAGWYYDKSNDRYIAHDADISERNIVVKISKSNNGSNSRWVQTIYPASYID